MTLSVMNVGKLGIWPGDVPKMRITERRGEEGEEEGVEEGVEEEEELGSSCTVAWYIYTTTRIRADIEVECCRHTTST